MLDLGSFNVKNDANQFYHKNTKRTEIRAIPILGELWRDVFPMLFSQSFLHKKYNILLSNLREGNILGHPALTLDESYNPNT